LGVFLLWQIVSVVTIFPHFLAYFNELVGGPNNGYLYVVDSNLDWGQDLKRLNAWIENYNKCAGDQFTGVISDEEIKKCTESIGFMPQSTIDKIYVDYFGGGNTQYYLGQKFVPWWGTRNPNELPKGSWLAVSASQLQGGIGFAVKGYPTEKTEYYTWLNGYKPIAKIGYSIFVFKID
jgi:hypothetical protein